MRLTDWIKSKNLTPGSFAKMINVSRSQVHKYMYEGAVPRYKATVLKIFKVTKGQITPNDLFGINIKTCDPGKCKAARQLQKLQQTN